GGQAATAAHYRGHTHPGNPRVDHRAQTDFGRYALHQIIRQNLARDRAKYAEDPARYADRHAGAPGSTAARQRALRARQIYEDLRPEIDAFRQLPGVEIVPSRAFKIWLSQQVKTSADLS